MFETVKKYAGKVVWLPKKAIVNTKDYLVNIFGKSKWLANISLELFDTLLFGYPSKIVSPLYKKTSPTPPPAK